MLRIIKENSEVGPFNVRGYIATWTVRPTDDNRFLVTPGNKSYPSPEVAKAAIRQAEKDYYKAHKEELDKKGPANPNVWADHNVLWVTDIDGNYY